MRLSFGQEMRMAQKQVLAPRMIQSMEILQLPILALQERIEQEMQENPCLDLQESSADGDSTTAEASAADTTTADNENPDAPAEGERELVVDEGSNQQEDFERLANLDEDWGGGTFDDGPSRSRAAAEEASERKLEAMANMVARPESFNDYLVHQLSWFDVPEKLQQMAERIIFGLDANGYLKTPLADFVTPAGDPDQLQLAEQALALVQKLDPPGVGARDLQECLLLQLTPGMPYSDELRALISNHLDDLANNRLPIIEKKTGYSIEQINAAWTELRKLKSKPGADFVDSPVPNVTPDVYLDKADDGSYQVRLEDTGLPNLYISRYYRLLLQVPKTPAETRDYIKRKVNAAQWLIESIEQRRSTLTKVAQAIVDHQLAFVEKGPEFIEPLKMQQIADKVKVHVTTVSRAVDDKWIQTPRGIFPLRRFFVGGTTSADGEEVAWDAVRIKLQEVIDGEDKTKPFSDEELVSQLAKHGITVARRTVTKYRKAMSIPSSRQRRDWTKKE